MAARTRKQQTKNFPTSLLDTVTLFSSLICGGIITIWQQQLIALPIQAQVRLSNHLVRLEVAQTSQLQTHNLKQRTALADNKGMLFTLNPPRPVSVSLNNIRFPLDTIFLRDGQVKAIAASVPPCKTNPCPSFRPGTAVNQVIQLRGGRAAELGLKVGDRLPVQFLGNAESFK